jgi:[protein-PII] uridylyltransferase
MTTDETRSQALSTPMTIIPLPPLPSSNLDDATDPPLNLRAICKEYRVRVLDELATQHAAHATGTELVTRYTQDIDRLIQYLFDAASQIYAQRNPRLNQRCTVFAQGGYGRGELNPYSDLDLLFLYHWKISPYVETICETLFLSLHDAGFDVGHAVRNIRECVSLANRDFQVKTSLIDYRYLCGDEPLVREFTTAVEREIANKNTDRFFQEKAQESQDRHRRYGDSIYILEPHLKEGKGGLRDLHTAGWLAKVKFKIRDFRELIPKGVITATTLKEVTAARDFLWRVRNALHLSEHAEQDLLTFERQDALAPPLGFATVPNFMREYYRHATTISTFSEVLLERCRPTPRFPGFFSRPGGREIRPGVRILGGTLVVSDAEILTIDPLNVITVFHDAQRHEVQIDRDTQRLLADHAQHLPPTLGDTPEARAALFTVLAWKQRVAYSLTLMHDLGVLGMLLPEFGRLRWQTQRDMYHFFTVDEHSLRGIVELERLRTGDYKAEHPLLTQVIREIDKIEFLFLSMLYHDVGKGHGHDHDERGAAMTLAAAARWHLPPDETHEWHFLVQHHLHMSAIAQRRDLSDETVIAEMARMVGTPALLKKLYLLTFADMKAVGPRVWNPWKGGLLDELYLRTLEWLETGEPIEEHRDARLARRKDRLRHALRATAPSETLDTFLAAMPESYLLSTPEEAILQHFQLVTRFLHPEDGNTDSYRSALRHFPEREYSELTIVTQDRPGLFAMLTGVLATVGLSIGGARISTSRDGLALDVFQISHADRQEMVLDVNTWTDIYRRLHEVLQGKRTLDDLLRAARPIFPTTRASRYGTEVEVNNTASANYTVIDITAPDRMGLLFSVTHTLFTLGLVIHLAKINTNVDHVLDVFYVTERNGGKIANPDQLAGQLREQLQVVRGAA